MRRIAVFTMAMFAAARAGAGDAPGIAESLAAGPRAFLDEAVVGPQGDGSYVVATTQKIDPAGTNITFPGRPVDLALNPEETLLAAKSRNDLIVIDLGAGAVKCRTSIIDHLPGATRERKGGSYHGIAWSADGRSIWLTSSRVGLHRYALTDAGELELAQTIPLPGFDGENSAPGGFYLDEAAGLAYVALSRNNSVAVVDLAAAAVAAEIPVGIAPFTVLARGGKAYVTNWGGRRPRSGDITGPTSGSEIVVDAKTGVASTGSVSVLDLAQRAVIAEIDTGLHPCGMTLNADGSRLYVANANSDTVSVIDTGSNAVVDTLVAKPMPNLPFGSAPNAVALSKDEKTLYTALGGNNALAVIDLESKRVTGLIPTGWYPGDVILDRSGSRLIIANVKGIGGRAEENNPGRTINIYNYDMTGGYHSHDHMGSVTIVAPPDADTLKFYTTRVATNMRLPQMLEAMTGAPPGETRAVPVPTRPGETSVFKYVLYIIKENRTYDQVLGDLPQGNGDPSYCHFGREVTPNHHALAETFVLLDNFYCNGVLSADGHQWTNESYVTDYIEKSFGGWPRSYPYDGDDAMAYASSGFIWDKVLEKNLSFRVYGEFVEAVITPDSATWRDIYNDYLNGTNHVSIQAKANLHTLEPYLCPTFVGFPGKVQDVYRAREFIKELKAAEAKGEWHNFMIMLLPNDHTVGTREGFPTPRATVADNDLGLGQIVEAVTHSKFWPETAIFVVEDDPQAGLDHVDGRRTVAFCISPYTKRGAVISKHYNQSSMLRTIELILGLTPMNQLDMAATPMTECFMDTPDLAPYRALPNNIPLDEMNPPLTALAGKQLYYAQKSMEMPLDDIDQADEDLFNRILWHSVKGYDTPYPQLTRRPEAGREAWPGAAAAVEED